MNALDGTIEEKNKELLQLQDERVALEKRTEGTYSPEWNEW